MAPASLSESAAKLSTGAFKIGTNSGLFCNENGTPENHTGGRFGDRISLRAGGVTGTTVSGVSLSGKCEMSGVPGGGRTRENSEASEDRGVCLDDRAIKRFVSFSRRVTRDCGVISGAKPTGL